MTIAAIWAAPGMAQQDAPPNAAGPRETITVIGNTPLLGYSLPKDRIAGPVQTATAEEMARRGGLSLADYLNRAMGGVYINEIQNNPFQPDVSYRGYTASPLLGTPQGLSIYLDGVRVNQPFGDIVSWDLIPQNALKSLTLMPGSNPTFGLNTLGGALALETKDGRSHPGSAVEGQYGSHDRRQVEVEHGGASGLFDWFVAGTWFKEDGWRDDSPSEMKQAFGKVGFQDERTDLRLSGTHTEDDLIGNGLQEMRLLERRYASIYTKPDQTKNLANSLTLNGRHDLSDSLRLSGNTYWRRIQTTTLNGDINDDALEESVYQPGAAEQTALRNAGYTGFPTSGATAANTPFPVWRCIGNVLLQDEPGEKCNGLLNRTGTVQKNYGITGQIAWQSTVAGRENLLTVGAAHDESRIRFRQLSELGYLTPDHGVTGTGAFADGVTGGEVDGEPYDTQVRLNGRTRTSSVYASDTLALTPEMHLTLSGRYNHTNVKTHDLLVPGGGPTSLNGDHTFRRFNPAVGLTWSPVAPLNLYAGYNEGSRAPAAVELGCANPDQPCKLPNAFAGDPPLHQVVTRNIEAGVRGTIDTNLTWNAGLFRSVASNDILFVADDQAGFGYFKNFGKTRRQGIELGLGGRLGRLSFGANYTFLDATYRTAEAVDGSSNSSNEEAEDGNRGLEGEIEIEKGDKIPTTPRHMVKLNADYEIFSGFTLGGEMLSLSGSYARGNENNRHQPDGTVYLGPGKTKAYTIFNLRARWQVIAQVQIFGGIDNLFDKRYATSAQLGPAGFDADGNFLARPLPAIGGDFPLIHSTFYAPGAPRLFHGGIRVTF